MPKKTEVEQLADAQTIMRESDDPDQRMMAFKHIMAIQYPAPAFEWHSWCPKIVYGLTRYSHVILTGPAASSKSSLVAAWLVVNWSLDPEKSTGTLTSTSVSALKTRVWGEVLRYHRTAKYPWPGEPNYSDVEIRNNINDEKAKIRGIAVKSGGNVQEAVDRIIGVHNEYMYVAVDEATSVPEAIVKACRNLNKGCKKFQLIMIGNASDHSDPHGRAAEPKDGWSSVTIDDWFWETRTGGCCIHLDGLKSPAIEEPKKLHFLINQKQIDEEKKFYGSENDPEFMRFVRGWWGGAGQSRAIITDAMVKQYRMDGPANFQGKTMLYGALDPAFEGGDRRAFRVATVGEGHTGKLRIQFKPARLLEIDTDDRRYIHDRLAEATIEAMLDSGIDVSRMIIDTSGEGQGVYEEISRKLGTDAIHMCEFGGRASDRMVNQVRQLRAYQMYANKVTELWMEFRRFALCEMIRGLDEDTLREFKTRRRVANPRGNKTQIETKRGMKERGHRSPDLADSCVMIIELLMREGHRPEIGAGRNIDVGQWRKKHGRRPGRNYSSPIRK